MLMLPRGRKVGPAIFDRRNQKLTQGLVGYYPPVLTGPTGLQLLDLSGENNTGTLAGMDASTDWVDSAYGKVLDFDGTNDHVLVNDSDSLDLSNGLTLSFWARTGSSIASVGMLGAKAIVSPLALSYRVWIQSRLNFQISSDGGTTNVGTRQSSVLATDTHYFFCCRFQGSTIHDVFVNGRLDNSTFAGTIRPSCFVGATPFLIGAQAATSSTISAPFLGQIAEVCIWNRALTPSEINTLYGLEPGGLGRRQRDDFFLYEAAIAYSLEASVASYALTGQSTPLLYGRVLPADTGSVLLSGQTTPLLTSRLLNADQGSYAYSGTDAATLLGRLLDAGAAAYTLDGTAAGFLASRRISADTVAYLASGFDAGFLRSRVLEAGTGQYVLVASPVNLQTGTFGTGGAAPYYYLFLLGGSR